MSKKQKLINGPLSCYRLEGTVEGIKKVGYFFGDFHLDIDKQYHYDLWKSENFIKYFVKTISKTDKKINYDLFFEINRKSDRELLHNYDNSVKNNKSNKNITNITKNYKYIWEFTNYFNSTIKIVNNKNIGSKNDPNLRLHIIDIRMQLSHKYTLSFDILNYLVNNIYNISHNFSELKLKYYISQIQSDMYLLQKESYNCLGLFYETDKDKIENIKNFLGIEKFNEIQKLINKIKHVYVSQNIKKKLTMFIDLIESDLTLIYKTCDEISEILQKILNMYKSDSCNLLGCDFNKHEKYKKYTNLLRKKILIIDKKVLYTYAHVMDIYTLRRFLDKTYIDHGIFYAGALHTNRYLYILVKKFDFKITHSTNKIHSIKKITELINKNSTFDEFWFSLGNNIEPQCIDLTDFPDLFL
jgi:hypothetical protein